ncbi:hypothetical protein M427DRAFT_58818 [Gonapodya prolifera JEL478]|uniref:Uncharacterized protein n=1 Tax=Gonapodya prolifera (strain JEL478) TaxID=1344416 RepID=A0A139A908_GONPJ|nr:hypothetical protein M427DRAFT_58818 [Gonapodya prolifera JEL478]|eukprot:KXS13280.1 hypothetical protein M427DRAFT_58818 [Gonapodya prolifera JEL478]
MHQERVCATPLRIGAPILAFILYSGSALSTLPRLGLSTTFLAHSDKSFIVPQASAQGSRDRYIFAIHCDF